MIASLSPLTRRIVAIGLVAVVALLALAAVQAVAAGLADATGRLEQARARTARLEGLRSRPAPPPAAPLPAGLAFAAPSHRAAAAVAGARINAAAVRAELASPSASALPQDPTNPGLIRVALVLEGPEAKVLGFIEQVERDPPNVRLRAWRLTPVTGETPGLRLEATAVAAWEAPR